MNARAQSTNFGLVIAFIAPGAVVLWGFSRFSSDIQTWFGIAAASDSSVGGFLFVLLAAAALGVFVSGVRWALIDGLMARTGLARPDFDLTSWADPNKLAAYEQATELYYRYYQFYANMLVALPTSYSLWLAHLGVHPFERPAASLATVVVMGALLASARNSLDNYYRHLRGVLGTKS